MLRCQFGLTIPNEPRAVVTGSHRLVRRVGSIRRVGSTMVGGQKDRWVRYFHSQISDFEFP